MNPHIAALTEKIRALEKELDAELAKRRAELRIGLEHGRVAFEEELLRRHRALHGTPQGARQGGMSGYTLA